MINIDKYDTKFELGGRSSNFTGKFHIGRLYFSKETWYRIFYTKHWKIRLSFHWFVPYLTLRGKG